MELESFEPGPRRFLRPELARVGVEVIGARPIRLRCQTCGGEWTPRVDADGHIAGASRLHATLALGLPLLAMLSPLAFLLGAAID